MKYSKGTYGFDKEFLQKHLSTVELQNGDSKLILSPDLQGRIVTSSAEGDKGYSFGWINYDLIASGEFLPHCNNFGGEDRYWIGPEGGQYSIFFKNGDPYDLDHWQTPAPIDTESWKVLEHNAEKAVLKKDMELLNNSGYTFKLTADREIKLLDQAAIKQELDIELNGSVDAVCFKSTNKMTNNGDFEWNKETGMLSIWVLGQLIPSDRNTVILPFEDQTDGEIVNDSYFGKVDDDRLKILKNAVLFKGDGQKRGKIGVGPKRTKPVIGSYDPINQTLTIVKFTFDADKEDYINSMWEHQKEPFKGDVINSYNDGPLPDGTIMGPFYELETSSAAANLKPGETLVHEHATFHFKGDISELDQIATTLLGVSINDSF
ncbi:hypothetical protein EYV94_15895 [Puteibacter caeruleilacunae]|nr:hypothetical protein EYV94_15895 [Puteibacter caeruleilacunae]